LHVDDAELPAFDILIHVENFDNLRGFRALLELFEDSHLILMSIVRSRLAGSDTDSGNDHSLEIHQVPGSLRLPFGKTRLRDACCRRDYDLPRLFIDRNDRPCSPGRRVKRKNEQQCE